MRVRGLGCLVIMALAVLGACGGDGPTPPPPAGYLGVSLSGLSSEVGGIVLQVTGPNSSGVKVTGAWTGIVVGTSALVVDGGNGPVLCFHVPDVSVHSQYQGVIKELAARESAGFAQLSTSAVQARIAQVQSC